MSPRFVFHRRLALAAVLACSLLPAVLHAQGSVPASAVRFGPGTSTATMNGQLKGPANAARDYVVRADRGQTLGVRLQTASRDVFFTVLAPNYGDKLYSSEGDQRTEWSGQVIDPGDYRVRVYLTPEAARAAKGAAFTLAVDLK